MDVFSVKEAFIKLKMHSPKFWRHRQSHSSNNLFKAFEKDEDADIGANSICTNTLGRAP
jgi:hypothetical protein